MEKKLVVWYSRTGNTKKVGEKISEILKADSDEIMDMKDRKGFWGYFMGGKDTFMKKLTEINIKKDAANYNLVVMGTPNWGSRIPPAIRTYIMQNKDKIKRIAIFCTQGGSGGENLIRRLEEEIGKQGEHLILREKEIKDDSYSIKVKEFCKKLI